VNVLRQQRQLLAPELTQDVGAGLETEVWAVVRRARTGVERITALTICRPHTRIGDCYARRGHHGLRADRPPGHLGEVIPMTTPVPSTERVLIGLVDVVLIGPRSAPDTYWDLS